MMKPAERAELLESVPLTPRAWLLFNAKVGSLTFGMGAITPMYERMLVHERKALTSREFQEILTVCQVLPGPTLVSLAMYLGRRLFGPAVALLGVLCLCCPGAVWALLFVRFVPLDRPDVRAVFRGFAVVSLILLVDMVVRLLPALGATHAIGESATPGRSARRVAIAIGVGAAVLLHAPMMSVALVGAAACLVAEFAV
jgi:chromate transport protein ChrA